MLDYMLAELGDRDDLVRKCVPTYPHLWQAHPAR
jgi:hypothetical protein